MKIYTDTRFTAAAAASCARVALHTALVALPLFCSPSFAATPLDPPQWAATENGVMLQRMTDQNTKLPEGAKGAKRTFDQGLELAERGADEEEQRRDDVILGNAEAKFTLIIEELAPDFAYAYTNRANVRIARGNNYGAIADYGRALELAPLAKDAWVTQLNLGSTLLAVDRPTEAFPYFQRSVDLSKGDLSNGKQYTVLGRANCYHQLGKWDLAIADFGLVLDKYPGDVQPWWLRYAVDLDEVGRRQEALGLARRLASKFDIEPETTLTICSLLWRGNDPMSAQADRDEALRRWKIAPESTKEKMLAFDVKARLWPPSATAAAASFRGAVGPEFEKENAVKKAADAARMEAQEAAEAERKEKEKLQMDALMADPRVAALPEALKPAADSAYRAPAAAPQPPPVAAPAPAAPANTDNSAAELARLQEQLAALQRMQQQ